MLGDTTTNASYTSDDSSLPAAPRRTIPRSLATRYEDITLIGEGGMGTVYRARDPRLGRFVALKLIKSDDPALWQRFIQEAKSQARIEHDCVCRVYEAGQADGEPYIAMQYIDGEPFSRLSDRLTLEERVRLVMNVALAVHEAHRLGLIHRDIKPGNILVETQDDGSLEPYIVDFGLAREVENQGQTVTGAVVGTPAYMSPEQARGEVRSMDRRSDVYSLGATLYDVLAGRPPFVAESTWKLLVMIEYDDPLPLGKAKKGIPIDLETIVMKCIERDPARRYDSAKALAEDLKRFLDGDAILAKRSSWAYVLGKKARKHKFLVSLTVLALVAAAVPLGAWMQSRRQMAMQVELSRALGEDVKTMELYLRAAYELPLHDVEKERNVVRARLADIERRMKAAGEAGEGPGHYALGRGHLALGDIHTARKHLEQAKSAGYVSPELEYALGRVLGELYRQELEASKRIPEGERRKAKLKEIETTYRDPALVHLRAAGTGIESPAYVEGLIAFYEGNHEHALTKARQAFTESSMMYEAKKLEADVLLAQGSKYRHDAAFDYDKMMTYFGPAAEGYAAAADIARSDPDVHRAECELWTLITVGGIEIGKNPTDPYGKTSAACVRAMDASSKDGAARVQLAFATNMLAFYEAQGNANSADPAKRIADAIRLAEDARRVAPTNAMAQYAFASAFFADTYFKRYRARDARVSIELAIEAYEEAIRLDPQFSWAHMELAGIMQQRVFYHARFGLDYEKTAKEALATAERAMAVDPDFPFTWNNKALIHVELARAHMDRGMNPNEQLQHALAAYRKVERLSPNHWMSHNNTAEALSTMMNYETLVGENPTPTLELAQQSLKRAIDSGGGGGLVVDTVGEIALSQASYLLRENRDPTSEINEARRAFRQAVKVAPWKVVFAHNLSRTDLVALRWAMKQHHATTEMFDEALAPLKPFLSDELADPNVYVTVAEVHALRAEWLLASKKNPAGDIERGLAMTNKALAINSRKSQALAVKGQILLTKALATRDSQEKSAAAQSAQEALERAFKENPLLEREYGTFLRQVRALQ